MRDGLYYCINNTYLFASYSCLLAEQQVACQRKEHLELILWSLQPSFTKEKLIFGYKTFLVLAALLQMLMELQICATYLFSNMGLLFFLSSDHVFWNVKKGKLFLDFLLKT